MCFTIVFSTNIKDEIHPSLISFNRYQKYSYECCIVESILRYQQASMKKSISV